MYVHRIIWTLSCVCGYWAREKKRISKCNGHCHMILFCIRSRCSRSMQLVQHVQWLLAFKLVIHLHFEERKCEANVMNGECGKRIEQVVIFLLFYVFFYGFFVKNIVPCAMWKEMNVVVGGETTKICIIRLNDTVSEDIFFFAAASIQISSMKCFFVFRTTPSGPLHQVPRTKSFVLFFFLWFNESPSESHFNRIKKPF